MLGFKASHELQQSFQNSKLEVSFFQIARAPKANGALPFSTLSRLNVRCRQEEGLKPIMEDHLKCHIKGLEAYSFATNGMKALVHVLQSKGEKLVFMTRCMTGQEYCSIQKFAA
jgi:glutamyl-tRNA reductase